MTKGNTRQSAALRTQGWESVSNGLLRVREAARRDKRAQFTALLHHVTTDLLRESYRGLKRGAAPGVDGVTWQQYEEGLEERLSDLKDRVHRGAYRAQPSKRTYIPKADGRRRPLGIASLEDKIVQQAVVTVLNQVYEEDFLGFSYGFRPGRSQHDALDALWMGITTKKVNWVLDADIQGFLETSSYYTPASSVAAKRPGWLSNTLMRRPLRRPWHTCTARSSPRFTRCKTVCRETPSIRVATCMATYPGGGSSTKRSFQSSATRIRQGAPGVICSPAMNPSLIHR